MKPPRETLHQKRIDTIKGLSKNVIGIDTNIMMKLDMSRMNIDLFDCQPPILMPIFALSKAPLTGAEVDIITKTVQVNDLLTPNDSS